MTNFDFLKNTPGFDTFADVAISAEKILHIDVDSCVLNCRRAMEFAVKWMYSVDRDLVMPYQDTLVSLMNDGGFRDIIGTDIWRRIEFIRKLGNNAAHGGKKVSKEQAELCLENLFYFLDCIAYLYAPEYTERQFDKSLLTLTVDEALSLVPENNIDINKLIEENKALKDELTARRAEQQQTYVPKPLDVSEYETRKIYIDTMLQDAGWTEGKDLLNRYPLQWIPNHSETEYADYVLFDDAYCPLAVIESIQFCKDVAIGRQQAKLYADLLEKKFGRRPVIFLTNGFDTRIWNDKYYPERRVSGFYSKRDLEKEFNKLTMRTSLAHVQVNDAISGRYYQKEAVKAVCRAFDEQNRRKALLVMATGSGKTRTVISVVDVLLRHGWVKNILFLADRTTLVTQAKRAFKNLLPDLTVTNLCNEKDNLTARGVFSTYQTIMNFIDDAKDENDIKLFTAGHFDLIICDEAHRSIYNKYKSIFNYFDAHLIGLTATPRDEIDKNTYGIFELESGVPTYGYDLAQAVQDGYLVDYVSVETKLKFIEKGIAYDDLSHEDKEEYENLFASEDDELPARIGSSALNEWIFNEDTIRKAINILMTRGIKIEYGSKIGKTIIFANNHRHAEKIKEIFNKEYPSYRGYCRVIDNYTNNAQSLIDDFSDSTKMPQIVVSVDMMDTGIDIPEVVNLVFFKRVLSKSKFWQMIGRGTRLCPALIDGQDKNIFCIFDFCGNFEFFRMFGKGKEEGLTAKSVQERIFILKTELVFRLKGFETDSDDLTDFRLSLIDDLVAKVRELNINNFAVHQHLRYIDRFSKKEGFNTLTYENTLQIAKEIAPLILPYEDDPSAVRFDALMYGLELAYIRGKNYSKARLDLARKAYEVSGVTTIPEVKAKNDLIVKLFTTDYIDNADIHELEYIRTELRDIMKYIPVVGRTIYQTDFTDDIISVEMHESELDSNDLQNYKNKVNHYIRQHMDNEVIAKLHTNKPLTVGDIKELEKVLWSELGTKDEYEKEYMDKPLGVLVREIVGLDMNSAKEAFAKYLNDVELDDRQIYFVNKIIDYIVTNGILVDFKVLQEAPFTDKGDVTDVFADTTIWLNVMKAIKTINANAYVGAA